MRFDMHCHTKEGSLDGKVPLKDYVLRLKKLGYDGMLITDHNSYKAYRYYTRHASDPEFADFVVLKGIEYDTCDAGHILVVMPEGFLPILEMRGLPVRLLIEIVHAFHGILGPAHPCGEKFLSITNCKYYKKHPEVIGMFDFLEAFNSCVTDEANEKAIALGEEYGLPCTAGSDSHKFDNIGLAWTEFDATITSETELINYIKGAPAITRGGSHYGGTKHDHIGWFYDVVMLRAWYVYSKMGNRRSKSRRGQEWLQLLTQSSNLVQRIQALVNKGIFFDLVGKSESKRLERLMSRRGRLDEQIAKMEAYVSHSGPISPDMDVVAADDTPAEEHETENTEESLENKAFG